MKIAVFGATRGTGRAVVEQALARGHEVTAFARNPAAVAASHARLRVVQGDAFDAAAVARAVQGQDAVVSSLGWIQGRRRARVTAPTAHLDFRNYLQLHGVRPGLNTFTVTEDVLRGRCFESVSLLPDSGVGATSVRPDELRLLVPSAPVVAVAGRRTRLRFAVVRRGGRPDGSGPSRDN